MAKKTPTVSTVKPVQPVLVVAPVAVVKPVVAPASIDEIDAALEATPAPVVTAEPPEPVIEGAHAPRGQNEWQKLSPRERIVWTVNKHVAHYRALATQLAALGTDEGRDAEQMALGTLTALGNVVEALRALPEKLALPAAPGAAKPAGLQPGDKVALVKSQVANFKGILTPEQAAALTVVKLVEKRALVVDGDGVRHAIYAGHLKRSE